MQIQHPTAAVIARTATAQDDITGDGTTSIVLFTGELLKQAAIPLAEGLHPRIIAEGFERARDVTIAHLNKFKVEFKEISRDLMVQVAQTSLRSKVAEDLADHLTEVVVDAVETIMTEEEPADLHMIEIMSMQHQTGMDTRFIRGLVLDHGFRHPLMAKRTENCFILTLNVSLEFEKSTINSGFNYSSAEMHARQVKAERKFTDDRVQKVIDLKERVCVAEKAKYGFMVINQKGIDPISLDMLQRAGIVAVRRAKRRNMERLGRACGGYAVNSVEELAPDCLGFAGLVYEHTLGEDKFTFVEQCKNPTSCTILVKGPNDHTVRQIKDAVRDGLRAVKNLLDDKSLVPGAGAFEISCYNVLQKLRASIPGRAKLGVQAFAEALLVIPKTLASNSGLDVQASIIDLLEAGKKAKVGLDLVTGKPIAPDKLGIWDNTRVKQQFLQLGSMIAIKLLQVDEIIRAGRKMGSKSAGPGPAGGGGDGGDDE